MLFERQYNTWQGFSIFNSKWKYISFDQKWDDRDPSIASELIINY